MQEMACDRLPEAETAFIGELLHAPDGVLARGGRRGKARQQAGAKRLNADFHHFIGAIDEAA